MPRTVAFFLLTALPAAAAEQLIQLVDPLDEPEYYCVDVPGFRDRLNLDAALMAHTCKPGAADELYTVNHPAEGQLYMKAYDRCMEAASADAGAAVFMKSCTESSLQRFTFTSQGRVELTGKSLCLTVADEDGVPTGGPSHLRRDLTLEDCSSVEPKFSTWKASVQSRP